MRRSLVLVSIVVVAAAGCSSKKDPAPQVDSTRSQTAGGSDAASASAAAPAGAQASPSTPPVNNPADAKALAGFAAKSATASYDATYSFSAARAKGVLRIVASPPLFRVDITSGSRLAQFFQIDAGTVSCAKSQDKPVVCALVAGPGEKVPDVFDPRVQRLFTDGLEALAKDPGGYAISAKPDAPSSTAGVPVGRCFAVVRLADLQPVSPGAVTAPGKGFETGGYCFDPKSAVLTSVSVATGDLALTKAPAVPTAADFTPPATPQPLDPAAASAAVSPAP